MYREIFLDYWTLYKMLKRFLVKHCSKMFGAVRRKDKGLMKQASGSVTWTDQRYRFHSDSSPPPTNKLSSAAFSKIVRTEGDGLSLKLNGAKRSNVKLTEKKVQKQDSIDSLGTWDTTTDLPLAVDQTIASGKPIPSISAISIGVSSMMGRRSYNEDQYGFQQLDDSFLYFAVFDGHGGANCAKFCSKMFPKQVCHKISLFKWINFDPRLQSN